MFLSEMSVTLMLRTVRSLIGRLALSQWNRSEEAKPDSKQRHHEK